MSYTPTLPVVFDFDGAPYAPAMPITLEWYPPGHGKFVSPSRTTVSFASNSVSAGDFNWSSGTVFTPETSERAVSFAGSSIFTAVYPDRAVSFAGSTTLNLDFTRYSNATLTVEGVSTPSFVGESGFVTNFSMACVGDATFDGESTAESAFAALGRTDIALKFSFNKDAQIISRAKAVCGFVSDTPRQGWFEAAGSSIVEFAGVAIRNAAFNVAGGSSFIARGTPLHTARMLVAGTSSVEFASTGHKFSAVGASQFSPVFSSPRVVPTYEPTVDMCFVKSTERKVFVHTQ